MGRDGACGNTQLLFHFEKEMDVLTCEHPLQMLSGKQDLMGIKRSVEKRKARFRLNIMKMA